MSSLSWRHHTLIQSLLTRGPLSEFDFHAVFFGVTGKSPAAQQQLFDEYLRKINRELSYVQFELRACRNQYDGNVYYGVINTVADEQSKLGTKYTVPQIAFYKGIIEAIGHDATAQGRISNIEALNIRLENQAPSGMGSQSQAGSSQVPSAFRTFSMSHKEKAIEEFVEDQWLCSTPDGKIGLGVRSFLDLRSWFHNNEVPSCDVCNEAGVKAELCPNENCTVRIHEYCLKMKFSQKTAQKVCPGCGAHWPYNLPKVEVLEEENAESPSKNRPSKRRNLRTSRIVEEEDESSEPIQSQQPSETSTRKKLRRSRDADVVGSGPSQDLDNRMTTRRSSRLKASA